MADITLIFEEQPISLALTTATPINLVSDGGATYTAGTGISITGAVITNTAPDQTVTMTDGTGIDITGTYPNFTVTNTAPNVVQTLSIAGQDLTLSGGGGTVEIPGGVSDALGTGFTAGGGTGTIPAGTVATLSGDFKLALPTTSYPSYDFGRRASTSDFINFLGSYKDGDNWVGTGYNDGQNGEFSFASFFYGAEEIITQFIVNEAGATFQSGNGRLQIAPNGNISLSNQNTGYVEITNTTAKFTDVRAMPLGVEYADDYSATIVTNPTSFTDVTSVNLLKQTPVSYTNAAAPNNCIFYSTTLSKLAYKDPGGTVNPLY